MASINKVILVGNCARDAETRYMPNGDAATNVTIATSESWKDKNTGEKKELTEWHRCSFFRKLGEIAGQYLKKGTQVYVEGRLQTRKWTDKEGVERTTTEIIVDEMRLLGARPAGSSAPAAPAARPAARPASRPAPDFSDDDVPF